MTGPQVEDTEIKRIVQKGARKAVSIPLALLGLIVVVCGQLLFLATGEQDAQPQLFKRHARPAARLAGGFAPADKDHIT